MLFLTAAWQSAVWIYVTDPVLIVHSRLFDFTLTAQGLSAHLLALAHDVRTANQFRDKINVVIELAACRPNEQLVEFLAFQPVVCPPSPFLKPAKHFLWMQVRNCVHCLRHQAGKQPREI